MKQLLHSFVALLLVSFGASQVYAQCASDTLLYEDFQTQAIPATWTNLDIDGNTDANGRPQDWYISVDAQTTTPGDTNYVATASSWFNPAGVANNWLILDSIVVCSPDVELQWKSAPFEGPAFQDGYKVLVSTTTNAPAAFTDTIFIGAEDTTGAGDIGFGTTHTSFNGNNGILQEWQVALSAYNGQTIYIAFVHDSNDDNLIALDDIFIGILPSNDLAVNALGGPTYPMVPTTQVGPITYAGNISNNYGMGSNPKLQVRVMNMGALVFADSAMVTGMLPEGNDTTLSMPNTYTPMAMVGTYNVMGWVTSDSIDVVPDNDTAMFTHMVTDSVYAREEGPNTGDLSIGATNTGFIGHEFDILQTDDLTSVSYYRAGGGGFDSLRVLIYDMSGGQPNSLLASSPLIIDTATAAGWRLYDFGANFVNLPVGTYVVGIEEATTTSMRIGTNPNYFSPGAGWVFFNGNWSNPEDFNFVVTFQIRANFGTPLIVSVDQVEAPATMKVFPQPARDWLTIDLEQPAEHVTIYSMNGTVVRELHNLSNNQVSVQDLTPGIYLLEVQQDGQRFYARFNKQ